jgi:hypothetical protein
MELEGSIDGERWTGLPWLVKTGHSNFVHYRLLGVSRETYRFVRVTQTERNSKGNHKLGVQRLSLRGRIVEAQKQEPESPKEPETAEIVPQVDPEPQNGPNEPAAAEE